jgi:hypothetical protein
MSIDGTRVAANHHRDFNFCAIKTARPEVGSGDPRRQILTQSFATEKKQQKPARRHERKQGVTRSKK